jgi:hypothetical protein
VVGNGFIVAGEIQFAEVDVSVDKALGMRDFDARDFDIVGFAGATADDSIRLRTGVDDSPRSLAAPRV